VVIVADDNDDWCLLLDRKKQSGLVMLLPHAYEGQGSEHSSARFERFLQCTDDNPYEFVDATPTGSNKQPQESQIENTNWQVCNFSTPANYFHALRRQVLRQFRKPMVVMSPKRCAAAAVLGCR